MAFTFDLEHENFLRPSSEMISLQENPDSGDLIQYLDARCRIRQGTILNIHSSNKFVRWITAEDLKSRQKIQINAKKGGRLYAYVFHKGDLSEDEFKRILRESLNNEGIKEVFSLIDAGSGSSEIENNYLKALLGNSKVSEVVHDRVAELVSLVDSCNKQGISVKNSLRDGETPWAATKTLLSIHDEAFECFERLIVESGEAQRSLSTRAQTLVTSTLEKGRNLFSADMHNLLVEIRGLFTLNDSVVGSSEESLNSIDDLESTLKNTPEKQALKVFSTEEGWFKRYEESLKQRIYDLEQKVQLLEKDKAELESLSSFQFDKVELDDEIASLKIQLSEKEQALMSAEEKVTELQMKHIGLESKGENMDLTCVDKTSDNVEQLVELQSKIENLQQSLSSCQEIIQNHEQKQDSLTRLVDIQKGRISELLQSSSDPSKEEVNSLKERLASETRKLLDSEENRNLLNQKLYEYQQNQDLCEGAKEDLARTLMEVRLNASKSATTAEEEILGLQEQLEASNREIRDFHRSSCGLNDKIKVLEDQLLLKVQAESTLSAQLDQLKLSQDEAERWNNSLQDELQRYIRHEAKFKQKIDYLEQEIDQLKLKEAVRMSLEDNTSQKRVNFDQSIRETNTAIGDSCAPSSFGQSTPLIDLNLMPGALRAGQLPSISNAPSLNDNYFLKASSGLHGLGGIMTSSFTSSIPHYTAKSSSIPYSSHLPSSLPQLGGSDGSCLLKNHISSSYSPSSKGLDSAGDLHNQRQFSNKGNADLLNFHSQPLDQNLGSNIGTGQSPLPEVTLQKVFYMAQLAQRELVLSVEQVAALNKDHIRQLFRTDFKPYQDRIEKLEKLKWELCELFATHSTLVNDARAIGVRKVNNVVIDELRNTIDSIKQEAARQQISSSNTNVSLTSIIDPPQFSGEIDLLHYYEWRELFLSYLKSANIVLSDSSPLWRKALVGKAKVMVDRQWPSTFIPDYQQILDFLETHFGNIDDILKNILDDFDRLGKVPGGVSEKWNKALESTVRAIRLLNKLEALHRAAPHKALDQNSTVISRLHLSIPAESYYMFEFELSRPGANILLISRRILKMNEKQCLHNKAKVAVQSDMVSNPPRL